MKTGCFTLIVFLLSCVCLCFAPLPRNAVGRFAVVVAVVVVVFSAHIHLLVLNISFEVVARCLN